MFKKKILFLALASFMVIGLLNGCGSKPAKLVDGLYKVEYDNYDHDYKGQLELTISNGKITEVKYDEIDKNGKLKSQDAKYKESMEESSNTYPEKAYGELEQRLINEQTADIDVVTGATTSSKSFKALVKYALDKMANDGETKTAKIPVAK